MSAPRGLACLPPERRREISAIGVAACRAAFGRQRAARFWGHVEKLPDAPGCWLWSGAISTSGYGRFCDVYAHRYSYELHCGPIPAGLVLDHLCRVPSCVNPAHLEAVTERVNILRGTGYSARNARRTHCPKGHPLDGVTRRRNGIQAEQRYCRQCNRDNVGRRYAATRARMEEA